VVAPGSGTAHGQVGNPISDGSIGTVQLAPPPVDVSASVSTTEPGVTVTVSVQPPAPGTQIANDAVGTVQVGGAGAQKTK
jgi:hypothetical protein